MLVQASEKKYVLPKAAAHARDDIGEHHLVSVAEMRLAIDVVDGGRDVKAFAHAALLWRTKLALATAAFLGVIGENGLQSRRSAPVIGRGNVRLLPSLSSHAIPAPNDLAAHAKVRNQKRMPNAVLIPEGPVRALDQVFELRLPFQRVCLASRSDIRSPQ